LLSSLGAPSAGRKGIVLPPCHVERAAVFHSVMTEFFDITDHDRLPGRFTREFRSAR
jgi:hypothetical protein